MPQKDRIVLWPIYFDSTKSRNDGRRVGRRSALKSPALDELVAAARALNLNLEVEDSAAYPKSWWEKSGRVLVKNANFPKSSILRDIASKMKEARSTK